MSFLRKFIKINNNIPKDRSLDTNQDESIRRKVDRKLAMGMLDLVNPFGLTNIVGSVVDKTVSGLDQTIKQVTTLANSTITGDPDILNLVDPLGLTNMVGSVVNNTLTGVNQAVTNALDIVPTTFIDKLIYQAKHSSISGIPIIGDVVMSFLYAI
ncbi:unnamed protein product, partial [Oppiella nova]